MVVRGARAARAMVVALAASLLVFPVAHAAETTMNAKAIAPDGTLRAAINLGNPVLAGRDASGALNGVTVDIATELAHRLGVPLRLVPFDQAGDVADAAGKGSWDVAFLAIEPKRAEAISFTPPYVLIEGAYAVPKASAISAVGDVDKAGVRVAVIKNSAYDLFLTRTLKHATLERARDDAATFALFRTAHLDAIAGVRGPLAATVARDPDLRMVPGRFMAIEQAMGLPHAHAAAADELKLFVEDLKRSGFVAAALARHGQTDALVAPAAP